MSTLCNERECIARFCYDGLNSTNFFKTFEGNNCCSEFILSFDDLNEKLDNFEVQSSYTRKTCEENVCVCNNGVVSRVKTTCYTHSGQNCKSCNSGYHLEQLSCEQNRCECSNGQVYDSAEKICLSDKSQLCKTCDKGYHLESQTVNDIEFIECKPDQCTCSNGVGFQAENCKKHQAEFCESCISGYLLRVNDIQINGSSLTNGKILFENEKLEYSIPHTPFQA